MYNPISANTTLMTRRRVQSVGFLTMERMQYTQSYHAEDPQDQREHFLSFHFVLTFLFGFQVFILFPAGESLKETRQGEYSASLVRHAAVSRRFAIKSWRNARAAGMAAKTDLPFP